MDDQQNEFNLTTQIQTEIHLKNIQPLNLDNKNSNQLDNNLKRKIDKADLYKTEMCKSFKKFGFCKYNNKCQFAHEEKELRDVSRHPRYKTEICKTFSLYGDCNYGNRCCFLHDENFNAEIENNAEISLEKIIEINCENFGEKGKKIYFRNEDEILNQISENHLFNNKTEDLIRLKDENLKLQEIKTNIITSSNNNYEEVIGYPVELKINNKYLNLLNDYLKENL